MGRNERLIGQARQDIVKDVLVATYSDDPDIAIYSISVTNKIDDYRPKEKGYSVISRPERKAPDILVFKDGVLKSAWEVTNYSATSYFQYPRFMKYVNNLTKWNCDRIFITSQPENFSLIYENKAPEENIEFAENVLAMNKITLIYWGHQDLPKGWIDHEQNKV